MTLLTPLRCIAITVILTFVFADYIWKEYAFGFRLALMGYSGIMLAVHQASKKVRPDKCNTRQWNG